MPEKSEASRYFKKQQKRLIELSKEKLCEPYLDVSDNSPSYKPETKKIED